MAPIRVAIVGCGRISDVHELGYRGRDDAAITAVCDTNHQLAEQKAGSWGVGKVYTDFRQVLDDRQIDLVELLTPNDLHCPMTVAACRAGKHVSVQKPMALSSAEADQMIGAAEQAGVVLRVFENYVFTRQIVRAQQMIEAGEIGDVRAVRLHAATGTADNGWEVPMSSWIWRFDERRSGGGAFLFDHGYHLFSLAYALGGPVNRIHAWVDRTAIDLPTGRAWVDAPATIMFAYATERRYGVMDLEYTPDMRVISDYYSDDNRIEVVGDRGLLFISGLSARTVDVPPLVLYRDGTTTAVPLEGLAYHDSFIAATRDMIEGLNSGWRPRLDGLTGKAVLQIALAAGRSAATGKDVAPSEVE
jgi:predicted dehydrogenase